MTVFLDLDQVLADFDAGYELAFGHRPSKQKDDVNWKLVQSRRNFYRDLPPMPDLRYLWEFMVDFHPVILTGMPRSIPTVGAEKRAWVAEHLGSDVTVVTCLSREKYLHAQPGDILVDDWDRHKQLWVDRGGVWITHVCALDTVNEFRQLWWE